jgi:hypothetical protein
MRMTIELDTMMFLLYNRKWVHFFRASDHSKYPVLYTRMSWLRVSLRYLVRALYWLSVDLFTPFQTWIQSFNCPGLRTLIVRKPHAESGPVFVKQLTAIATGCRNLTALSLSGPGIGMAEMVCLLHELPELTHADLSKLTYNTVSLSVAGAAVFLAGHPRLQRLIISHSVEGLLACYPSTTISHSDDSGIFLLPGWYPPETNT